MSPDLPEKLLGISIDDPSTERRREADREPDAEELERFVFFSLGEQRLALPVDDVSTIVQEQEELTRVPRAPDAIDGITDLRGEITAVIDPRVHFPVDASPTKQRLLVLDRPTDQQPAALRIDDVAGVETVPASDVVEDRAELEAGEDDGALDHPLVAAVVRKRRRTAAARESIRAEATADGGPGGVGRERAGAGADIGGSGASLATESDDSLEGRPFEAESEPERDESEESANGEEVVETAALIDAERLLLASQQTA